MIDLQKDPGGRVRTIFTFYSCSLIICNCRNRNETFSGLENNQNDSVQQEHTLRSTVPTSSNSNNQKKTAAGK